MRERRAVTFSIESSIDLPSSPVSVKDNRSTSELD